MLDPITVIATASAAYNALKKGIEIGRELQDMSGQLAAWAGAVSDLDFLAKKAEAPAVVARGVKRPSRGHGDLCG
jgi:DNA-binding FrmR family transcriptional regulator